MHHIPYIPTRKLHLRLWVGYGLPTLVLLIGAYAQAWG